MTDSMRLELPSLEKLQSAEQMELLDVVDSLRACGLSEIISLPQLIVCGDQSSGKSSVLEAISGVPFPRQDNLCTRFATEVILRRAPKDTISVSIVPGKDRDIPNRLQLLQFRHDLKSKDDFSALFEDARDAMGLSSDAKSFSNDVLRVELSGPTQPQLTLVDLPGLIHSETKSQAPGSVKLVHELVSQYLESPRSIILAIVSAKNDISNQVILHRAREVDPKGLRTLGIITKPDLLVRRSKGEEAFISLARNEEVKFSLGWHVVKNLDSATHENLNEGRDSEEVTYFQTSSFNTLPAHILGIRFLRSRLSRVLFNQIRKELPRLVEDIQSQMLTAEAMKDKLGPSRSELNEQRLFLVTLSQTFQTICHDAVRGDYEHHFFRENSNSNRRLCANIMNMHFDFAKKMRDEGATWIVDQDDSDVGDDHHQPDYAEKLNSKDSVSGLGKVRDRSRRKPREEAIQEACALLKRSRGRELPGLSNPLLVGELFRQYSQPWEGLARSHVLAVWEATNRFLGLLLNYLTDEETGENIYRFWLSPIMEERLTAANAKLDELLEVHKDYPMTTNIAFFQSQKDSGYQKRLDQISDILDDADTDGLNTEQIARIRLQVDSLTHDETSDLDVIAAEEAFENMNAFYEVAITLFTDNVPNLVVHVPIIREVPKLFCPISVFSMGEKMVKQLAEESEEKVLERSSLLQRLAILTKGARICKQYAKRSHSFLNISEESNISELPAHFNDTSERHKDEVRGKHASNAQTIVEESSSVQTSALPLRKPQTTLGKQYKSLSSSSSLGSIESAQPNIFGHLVPKVSKEYDQNDALGSRNHSNLESNLSDSHKSNGLFVFSLPPGSEIKHFKDKELAEKLNLSPSEPEPSAEMSTEKGIVADFNPPLFDPFEKYSGFLTATAGNDFNFPTSRKSPPLPSETTIHHTPKPFVEPEPRSTSNQMNAFLHISFCPQFQKFSNEELRIMDYEVIDVIKKSRLASLNPK